MPYALPLGTHPGSQRAPRGSVLVAAVVSMTVLLLVVSTMVISGGREADIGKLRVQEAQALYAADAAANIALREARQSSDIDGDGAVGTLSNDGNNNNDPTLNGARMRVTPSGGSLYSVSTAFGSAARQYSMTLSASSSYADGFEGYTTGTSLNGLGGWTGWDNSAGAAGWSYGTLARSGAKSQDVRNTSDSVRTFNYTSGKWTFTVWQYIPSTVTGSDTYFILMNTYAAGGSKGWSTQIHFVFSNNTVADNMQGGVTGSTRTLVRNQWVPISVDIDLDAGTQTAKYNGQVLFTGSWNRQGGSKRLAAVDLYGSTANHVYYDDMSITATNGGGSTVTMVEAP